MSEQTVSTMSIVLSGACPYLPSGSACRLTDRNVAAGIDGLLKGEVA